ncbi:outer membrane protein assembly factor BamB [Saccharophagus degradans]|uniref:Outer membrane protein assembly factor BamB n=1 Tax=Saccharophagus degradans (strain 2-40 / ATCC 43961 / DSM 17024) TaxID=203122 RepID=Q21KT0_SACD2|nr:outer membrane protein assembly factor BamB [Saccharophagus degradans]ABD80699.1 Pyrrolo-quinoline quinone [Saccharophagus degradans 2-40]
MKFKLWALATACVLALGGCSSNKESENLKPLELVKFKSTVKVERVWSAKVGKGQDRRYTVFVPAVLDDAVFASDTEGNIFAFNVETGKRLWKHELDEPVSGAVGAGGGLVLVGTYEGEVVALDAKTGDLKWRSKASSEVLAPPQSDGSIAVASTIDARLFAYDAITGKPLWSHDHIAPVLTLRTTAAPVISGTQVLSAFDNGQMLAFSASDGSVSWEVRVAQPKGRHDLEKMVDIDGTPVVDSAFVYTTSYQGAVMAIARGTGRVLWKRDASSYVRPAVAHNAVYVATEDDRLVAYNASNGGTVWENAEMLRRDLSAPGVMGDYITAIDKKGYMHVVDRENGQFVARIKPSGDGFRSVPVSYKDGLILLSDDGVLSFYKAKPAK